MRGHDARSQQRATALDADNNSLHAELAKSQQQIQYLNEHIEKLSRQEAFITFSMDNALDMEG